MSEFDAVKKSSKPNTRKSIANDLKKLGLKEGMTVIVHSSLSSLGWVCGGPIAVIQALIDIITPEGNLVMPTHSTYNTDPSHWGNPPVPKEWWETIKETMPAFDPIITPTYNVGTIPEVFRKFSGVHRSNHPSVSFAAWGKNAKEITSNQSLDYSMGENSPLARIYDLDGYILLLGVNYDKNTSFHLSEYRSNIAKLSKFGGSIIENGKRIWKEYVDIDFNADSFIEIGSKFEKVDEVKKGLVGLAECKFFRQRSSIDFATEFLSK